MTGTLHAAEGNAFGMQAVTELQKHLRGSPDEDCLAFLYKSNIAKLNFRLFNDVQYGFLIERKLQKNIAIL